MGKFPLMLNRLDENEFNTFIAETLKTKGRDFITQLFINYYLHDRDIKEIKNRTQTIMDIIKLRKQASTFTAIDRIDKLPSALIGECASYLSQRRPIFDFDSNQQYQNLC
eukprot:TRINITY_DN4973_c0_g1_i1.p1 TRINITY_DN4973_c0_g1~~TRINITY_DN4973_c0_g1_i1.p1  ORF type:complete len:110 (-),score=4.45 TRINITY_DN4973_c0_g1_i1:6-335(-)